MTLLTIAQNACDELGIPRPTTVYGSSDPQLRQLLRIANRVGDLLYKAHAWTILQRLHSDTTIASTAEYSLPSDFGRFIDDTAWDATNYWEMRGPLTPQDWALRKYGIIGVSAFRKRWRVKRASTGNTRKFAIDPTPTSADDFVFEYVSNGWVIKASDSTVTNAWTADTDTTVFDEYLFEQGIIWRWGSRKGFDITVDLPDFENELEKAIARDGGASKLSLSAQSDSFGVNMQEGNFGGV